MKKGLLLNSELSYLIGLSGHTDELTIADAGLPIHDDVSRIDLALVRGTPGFIETLQPVLEELAVESVILAEEIKQQNPIVHQQVLDLLARVGQAQGLEITISYISHELFKQKTHDSRAVVRTGECTPYANIILQAGVAFS